jgi:hypothetical protein
LTSLDFDNVDAQTSLSDKEFEWNEDSGVVSKDMKHMKNHTNKITKNVVLDDQVDDDSSHFSQLSTTILQSEAESPHLSQLFSLNSHMEFSAIVIDGTRKEKTKKNQIKLIRWRTQTSQYKCSLLLSWYFLNFSMSQCPFLFF